MASLLTCFTCGERYTDVSRGSLKCSFHPKTFNYHHDGQNHPKNSYDCCGRELAKKNAVEVDSFNQGCQWIDHVSSEEELQDVLAFPYVCLKKLDFDRLSLSLMDLGKAKETVSVKFDALDTTVIFTDGFGQQGFINIIKEYTTLFALTTNEEDFEDVESSEIYYRDGDWDLSNVIAEKPENAEFYIVFRIPGKRRVIHVKIHRY